MHILSSDLGQACPSRTHIIVCMHARTHSHAMSEHPVPRAHTSSTRAGRCSRSTLWWESSGSCDPRERCSRTPRSHNSIDIDPHEHARNSLRLGLVHAAAPPLTARRGGTPPRLRRLRRAWVSKSLRPRTKRRPHGRSPGMPNLERDLPCGIFSTCMACHAES